MFFAIWACAVLLPLAVHTAFMATSQRAVRITVYSQEASVTYNTSDDELGECDKYRTAETMSCTFARHYLAKSFELTYISIANDTTFRGTVIEWECLLIFNRNYTAALQRRIKKKIEQYADFENSQIIVTINMTDARKSEHVIDKLLERYNEFLYDYARDVPADINYKYIKYNYTSTHNHYAKYPIYRRYVNSGLTVVLTFFFHASIAVRLMQVAGDNCYYEAWKSHLSRLAVQIPLAVMWNAFSVEFMHNLYHIKSHHGYVFLCLLLESVCGIHLGYVLCLFIKTYFKVTVIIYIILTACVYDAGLWWPPSELFGWNYVIGSYLPITVGINFVRNLIEKNDFVERSLLILTCWTIVFVIVVIVNIIATKNGKKYNKLKNLL